MNLFPFLKLLQEGPTTTGKLDDSGRILLDWSALSALGWKLGDPISLELLRDGSGMVLRLTGTICAHCGAAGLPNLIEVTPGSMICLHCFTIAWDNCNRK